MLMTTMDVDRPYDTIGLVQAKVDLRPGAYFWHPFRAVDVAMQKAQAKLEAQAQAMGADAIIGVRTEPMRGLASYNLLLGTAIRYR